MFSKAPHRAGLYVGDLLIRLTKARLKEDLALVVAFLTALGDLLAQSTAWPRNHTTVDVQFGL